MRTPTILAALEELFETSDDTAHAGCLRGISETYCYMPIPAAVKLASPILEELAHITEGIVDVHQMIEDATDDLYARQNADDR